MIVVGRRLAERLGIHEDMVSWQARSYIHEYRKSRTGVVAGMYQSFSPRSGALGHVMIMYEAQHEPDDEVDEADRSHK